MPEERCTCTLVTRSLCIKVCPVLYCRVRLPREAVQGRSRAVARMPALWRHSRCRCRRHPIGCGLPCRPVFRRPRGHRLAWRSMSASRLALAAFSAAAFFGCIGLCLFVGGCLFLPQPLQRPPLWLPVPLPLCRQLLFQQRPFSCIGFCLFAAAAFLSAAFSAAASSASALSAAAFFDGFVVGFFLLGCLFGRQFSASACSRFLGRQFFFSLFLCGLFFSPAFSQPLAWRLQLFSLVPCVLFPGDFSIGLRLLAAVRLWAAVAVGGLVLAPAPGLAVVLVAVWARRWREEAVALFSASGLSSGSAALGTVPLAQSST